MAASLSEYCTVAAYATIASLAAASVMFAATTVSYKDANGVFITATPAPYVSKIYQPGFTGNSDLYTPAPKQRTAKSGVCHPYQRNTPVDNGGC